MTLIPVFQNQSADFVQEIELGGQLISLDIIYNIRNEFFHLNNFTDQNGNPLHGIKIVPDFPLLDWHKGLIDFDGDLMVIKQDLEAGDDITYDNFGNGWNLFYLTPDEVDEWKDANGF
jgi:hypothetical protein